MKKLVIILLLIIPSTQISQAALPALAWTVIKELAIDTAIDAVQELFKDSVKPEDVAKLKQRITKLEQQITLSQKQGNYPSAKELNTVKQMVANLTKIVNTLGKRLNSVEARIAKVEQELASLRQNLLNVSKQDSVKIDKPLDFKINYVYRSGGKGNPKTLNNNGVLHSGDYYKIIFTPTENCYIYIFQLDSANQLFRLFPMQSFGEVVVNNFNPIKANKTYHIPSKNQSFELDSQIGFETIYFVATRQQDIVLEKQYQIMQQADTGFKQQMQKQVQQQFTRDSKGLRAIKPDPVATEISWQENGQQYSVLQERLEDMCNGCVNVLTFNHKSAK
ncbi:DUF4384 domain-containing protein [Thiotrichales bacterium HSG1]|nr:DUF4384 domain-containing protein [Thiotrichales bacterium HSG1]